jgi:hypothetical protein
MYANDEKKKPIFLATVIALLGSALLFAAPMSAYAGEAEIRSIQDFTSKNINNDQEQLGQLNMELRWSDPMEVDPNTVAIGFADCRPGEFPFSGQHIFQSSKLRLVESYAAGIEFGRTISWVFAIKNNDDQKQWVGLGAVCADPSRERGDDDVRAISSFKRMNSDTNRMFSKVFVIRDDNDNRGSSGRDVDIDAKIKQAISAKTTINNVVNNIINSGGNSTNIINAMTNIANGNNNDQKNKLTQFLVTAPQSGPELTKATELLTAASKEPGGTPLDVDALPVSAEPVVDQPIPEPATTTTTTDEPGAGVPEPGGAPPAAEGPPPGSGGLPEPGTIMEPPVGPGEDPTLPPGTQAPLGAPTEPGPEPGPSNPTDCAAADGDWITDVEPGGEPFCSLPTPSAPKPTEEPPVGPPGGCDPPLVANPDPDAAEDEPCIDPRPPGVDPLDPSNPQTQQGPTPDQLKTQCEDELGGIWDDDAQSCDTTGGATTAPAPDAGAEPATGGPELILCSDGVTQVEDEEDCPDDSVTCPDGSTAESEDDCPDDEDQDASAAAAEAEAEDQESQPAEDRGEQPPEEVPED